MRRTQAMFHVEHSSSRTGSSHSSRRMDSEGKRGMTARRRLAARSAPLPATMFHVEHREPDTRGRHP